MVWRSGGRDCLQTTSFEREKTQKHVYTNTKPHTCITVYVCMYVFVFLVVPAFAIGAAFFAHRSLFT